MANRWFVILGGREQGPMDGAALKAMAEKGVITADTMIRRDDMTHPVMASKVKGLLPEMPSAATTSIQATRSGELRTTVRAQRPVNARAATVPARRASTITDQREPTNDSDEDDADPVRDRASIGARFGAWMIDLIALHGAVIALAVFGYLMFSNAPEHAEAQRRAWWGEVLSTNKAIGESRTVPIDGWEEKANEWRQQIGELAKSASEAQQRIASASAATLLNPLDEKAKQDLQTARFEESQLDRKISMLNGDLEYWNKNIEKWAEQKKVVIVEQRRMGTLLLIAAGVLLLLITPLSEGLASTTPGKRILGLRVLDRHGRICGPGSAFARHFLRLLIGGQFMAAGSSRLALHDQLTGTQVTSQRPVRRARQNTARGSASRRGTA